VRPEGLGYTDVGRQRGHKSLEEGAGFNSRAWLKKVGLIAIAVVLRMVSVACGNVAAPCQEVYMVEVFMSKVVVVSIMLETAWAYLTNCAAGMATSS
jgi:hypothetical protein